MAAREPEMRAAHTQSLAQAIGRLPPRERDAVRAIIGPKALTTIGGALPVGWLPMSLHMLVSDAIRDTIGAERNVLLWRDTMTTSFDRPILRSFVAMTVNVFGADPAAFLRRGEQIYSHLTRNLGVMVCTTLSPTEGRVELRGFPARRFRFICYVEGLHGCLDAVFSICRTVGKTVVEEWDDERGDASYLLSWS